MNEIIAALVVLCLSLLSVLLLRRNVREALRPGDKVIIRYKTPDKYGEDRLTPAVVRAVNTRRVIVKCEASGIVRMVTKEDCFATSVKE